MDDGTAALLKQQIAEYKSYRDIITQSNATLLSAQAPVDSTAGTSCRKCPRTRAAR